MDTAVSKPDKMLNTVYPKTMGSTIDAAKAAAAGVAPDVLELALTATSCAGGVGRHRGAADAHGDRLFAAVVAAAPVGHRPCVRQGPAVPGAGRARQEYGRAGPSASRTSSTASRRASACSSPKTPYVGSNGYSLRLNGLERRRVNDRARKARHRHARRPLCEHRNLEGDGWAGWAGAGAVPR